MDEKSKNLNSIDNGLEPLSNPTQIVELRWVLPMDADSIVKVEITEVKEELRSSPPTEASRSLGGRGGG